MKASHRDRAAYHLLQVHNDEHAARASSGAYASSSYDCKSVHQSCPLRGTLSPTIGNDTSSTCSSARTGYRGDALLGGVTSRLLDRLLDVRARAFPDVLVIGGAAVHVLDQLAGGVAGVERVTVLDTSPAMLEVIKVLEADQRASSPSSKQWPQLTYSLMAAAPEPSPAEGLAEDAAAYQGGPEQQLQQKQDGRAAQMYELLPVEPGTFDLVISSVGLHWTNDLPGLMFQCKMALRPDGLFLAALFGGETLQEMRIACAVAAMERAGGVFPVVSPLAQMRDGGNLLTRAGFALPAVDCDTFVLKYPADLPASAASTLTPPPEQQQQQQQQQQVQKQGQSQASVNFNGSSSTNKSSSSSRDTSQSSCQPRRTSSSKHNDDSVSDSYSRSNGGDDQPGANDANAESPVGPEAVVAHLRLLGESNAVLQRQKRLQPDVALAASAAYRSLFREEDGTIPATFEVMYLTGWTPHPSQQRPSRRGSQTVSFQDLATGLGGGGSTNQA